MPSAAITIDSTAWTPITAAGKDATCWLIKEPMIGRLLVDHSDAGTGTLDIGKSYSIPTNKEVITDLIADNSDDIYYAICSRDGESGILVVDDSPNVSAKISSGNSTSTPLGAAGSFVGEWFDVTDFGIIYVNVYSDVASQVDGLVIQLSSDGINADHDDVYTVPAGIGKNYAVNPYAKYFRVLYFNGITPQTEFRLQSKINCNGLASSHRVKDDITTEDDARLVKSILAIKANDQNQYKNIERNNPMPINSGALYQSDVNLTYSSIGTFSGSPIDLLNNRWSPITDTSATNPKIILIEFEKVIQTSVIGIGTEVGSFSNTVIKYGLGTLPDVTLIDESADSTPKTIIVLPSKPITLSRIQLEFHTANTVTLTALEASKSIQVISQIQGVDPAGELKTIGSSYTENLHVAIQEYGDTSAVDGFGRARSSTPFSIFDSKQLHDKQPLFWDESLGGSATSTHLPADARTRVAVTASATDWGIRQTKIRPNYQAGKSQFFCWTFHSPQQTGVKVRVGPHDGTGTNYRTPYNGIFLEISENDISWNIAKNGTITESVSIGDWSYDNFDGLGPSRFTFEDSGLIIAFADIEWLGAGRVRTGFYINGLPRYAHFFTHANTVLFTAVYMSTPNLALRYYIESDGTGAGYLDHICSTVISEGGIQQTGILRSVNTGVTHIDANAADTKYAMIAIRLKADYYDITVLPEYFSMISETNDDFKWTLELNPTVNGTLTFNGVTDSAVEYALGTTANTVATSGYVIDSGFSKSSATIDRRIVTALNLGCTIGRVMDVIVLTTTPLSSNADLQGSVTYREL